ncbi:hypothetical protein OK006_8065 [Actinobacteria bacterium OK006]|nr:hypothetical protein OK006_8065 [Actinobacteria bacterium OK006]
MGRGRVPSEKTTRLDTPAGGRRPCPPRRNPAVGPGADGLGVPPETGHRRETEPHHQTQNQPAGHPHRRPGDQPAEYPHRRPGDRWDGTPPPDPGPTGGATPPEARHRPGQSPAASAGTIRLGVPRRKPRPPRRDPAAGPGTDDRPGDPRRRPGAGPGRNPAARPGTDDRPGDPGRRPGAGPGRNPAAGPGPDRLGVVGWRASVLRVGFVCPVGASDTARHAWRSVPIRAGIPAPQALLPPSRRSAATAESGGAEPTSPTRSVPGQAGGAETHRDPQAMRQAGPQRRTAQASASVTRPSAR